MLAILVTIKYEAMSPGSASVETTKTYGAVTYQLAIYQLAMGSSHKIGP